MQQGAADTATAKIAQARDIHISIVSHGHGVMLQRLLQDLSACDDVSRLQLTLVYNIPEALVPPVDLPFPVCIVPNDRPMGFAANHNRAFATAPDVDQRKVFVVLNPDVRLSGNVLGVLTAALAADTSCGVIAPAVTDSAGNVQQSARKLPHFWSTVIRFAGGSTNQTDTVPGTNQPDWVAGMLMAFPAPVYARLNGFDSSYRLYYEDVEICCRVWLAGLRVRLCPEAQIVHDGQWQSRRKLQHMRWHIGSALRFFVSPSYRNTCRWQRERQAR